LYREVLDHAQFFLEALSGLLSYLRQFSQTSRCVLNTSSLMFKMQHLRGNENVAAAANGRHAPE
jgi:hypothetical protein